MGAIAAGGKTINFDKKTIKDNKTGKVSSFKKTSKGIIIKPQKSSSNSSSSKTKVSFISDSKNDIGKSFARSEIKVVPKINRDGSIQTKVITPINNPFEDKIKKNMSIRNNRNVISAPPKKNISMLAREYTIPSTRDKTLKRIGKGVGSFVLDVGSGIKGSVQTGLKAIKGDKEAQKRIKESFSFSAIAGGIGAIGQQIQSPDPFERTKGFLSLGVMALPVKVPGIKVSPKISKITYKTTSSLTKDSIKTTIKETGTLGSKPYSAVTTLRSSGNTVIGQTVAKVEGKTIKTNHRMKERGGFYVDKKTGKRISKENIDATSVKFKIKEIKQTKIGNDRNLIIGGEGISAGKRSISVTTRKGEVTSKGVQEVSKTRGSEFDFNRVTGGRIKDAVSFKKSLNAKLSKTKKREGVKPVTDAQIKKFLRSIDYDKKIIGGLDKRTRLARALGLRKTSPSLKKFEVVFNKNVPSVKTIRGKVTLSVTKEFNNLKRTFGKSWGKRAQLLEKSKPLSKTEIKSISSLGQRITIPKLRSRIALTKALRIRGLIPAKVSKGLIMDFTKAIDRLKKQIPIKEPVKTPVKRTKVKTPLKVPVRAKAKVTPNKTRSKVPTKKTPIRAKTVKVPRPRLKKPLRLRVPIKLGGGKAKDSGGVVAYDLSYRRNGKVITKKIQLPKNKALKEAIRIVKRTPARSMQIKPAGKTKQKDIMRPSLKDFRLRKSKDVLLLVEIPKSAGKGLKGTRRRR